MFNRVGLIALAREIFSESREVPLQTTERTWHFKRNHVENAHQGALRVIEHDARKKNDEGVANRQHYLIGIA